MRLARSWRVWRCNPGATEARPRIEKPTRNSLHPRHEHCLHPRPLILAWIVYAITKSSGMESAAKRKAASAAVGDGDSRPAKRQKVPVRAGCDGGVCRVGGGLEMGERCRLQCGMAAEQERATPGGSTSSPSPPAAPPCHRNTTSSTGDADGHGRGLACRYWAKIADNGLFARRSNPTPMQRRLRGRRRRA